MIIIGVWLYSWVFSMIWTGFAEGRFKDAATILTYVLLFIIFRFVFPVFLMGYLQGNAIKVSEKQFPDVFEIIKNQSAKLGLNVVPEFYLLEGGGILNAFATRLVSKNHVVLYSDLFALAYQEGKDAVAFIVGHELGHIARNHVGGWKQWLMAPARMIPFVSSAYSRACEYTADAIGFALCPEGAQQGMLILAAGSKLYKKVNLQSVLADGHAEHGFAVRFAEKCASHPHLIRRITRIQQLQFEQQMFTGALKDRQPVAKTDSVFGLKEDRSNQDENPLL